MPKRKIKVKTTRGPSYGRSASRGSCCPDGTLPEIIARYTERNKRIINWLESQYLPAANKTKGFIVPDDKGR